MNTWASIFAIIADTTLKATVLLALAWAAGRALKNRSSASRHLVRTAALCAALLLPLLSSLLPGWQMRGLPQFITPPQPQEAAPALQSAAPLQDELPAPPPARAATRPKLATEKTLPNTAIVPAQQQSQNLPSVTQSPRSLTAHWPQLLTLVWLMGVIVCLCRLTISRLRLGRLVRNATLVEDHDWIGQLQSVAQTLGIRRTVLLFESADTEVPLTTGALHPKIILPADHSEWTLLRSRAVLQHELAHIKRWDAATQVITDLAVTLYWFHPLSWITAKAIRAERERACDDYVLALGAKPSEYAHELLEIASALCQPSLGAALAMARRSQLEGRLLALLNPALRRGAVSRKIALAIAALTLCIVFPLAAIKAAQQSKPSPRNQDRASAPQADQPASTPSRAAKPNTNDDAIVEAPQPPEAPEPPEPPELSEVPAPPAPGDSLELSDLRAHLADLLAQEAALKAQVTESNKQAEVQARLAALHAQAAAMRAQIHALAAAPVAGIPGGVPGGVPGGIPAAPGIPAVPGVPGVPAVPAVPAVPGVPPAPAGDLDICGEHTKLHNMSINSDNDHQHWIAYWSGPDCSIDLRADGNIEFNAEATEIQSISAGGFFEVDQHQGNTRKEIRVTPSANGLQYSYKVNGADQPFDTQAKAWFSNFLLELERSTGFAAESRVRKLLEKGGPDAVLEEINHLHGDYVRGIYFRKLLDQPNLPSAVVVRIINQAGRQVSSDYEKARILMEVARQYKLTDEASQAAFLNAAGSLKSDYEHSRVLIELLKRPNLSSHDVELALHSAAGISSDYEKSRVALSILEQKSFDQSYLDFYLKIVASIQSDYEKSRDLIAPMKKYPLNQKQIDQIMDATTTISSDYEKSRLLTELVNKGKFDEKEMGEYLKVVSSMGSDYERARSLTALVEHNTLSKDALAKALDATSHIGSDYEKSRVLVTIGANYSLDGALREKYISIANSLGDYECNRALAAIAKRAAM